MLVFSACHYSVSRSNLAQRMAMRVLDRLRMQMRYAYDFSAQVKYGVSLASQGRDVVKLMLQFDVDEVFTFSGGSTELLPSFLHATMAPDIAQMRITQREARQHAAC